MTEEQIRKNAEKCADGFIADAIFKRYLRDTYIAGAHSRDEEIERIKNEATAIMDEACALKTELDKLRNPWISVDDRLPEDAGKVVIVLTDMGDIFNSFLFRNKRGSLIWNSDKGIGKPIFWMYIPQIEKGE